MSEPLPHYHLLTAGTAADLSELVNQHLRDGYEVLGAPFSSPAGTVALLQAVVKYRDRTPLLSTSTSRTKLAMRAGSLPFQAKNGATENGPSVRPNE